MNENLENQNYVLVKDIIEKGIYCPLPLSVIPNYMGINLCSVEAVSCVKRDDGQLEYLTIHFIPEEKEQQNV